jgi:pimeloyl-ACP methyl ester carboxylesterase
MELTVDGRKAYAYTGGKPFDATLPCVVFIHGALNDHSVWTLLARWFAHHGHSVLAVDLPGHLRSAGPPLASVEANADWTIALLAAAGVVQPAALVGHSMGSLIGLEVAARAPERVSHLVMVATAYPMAVSDSLLKTARDQPLAAIDLVNSFSLSTLAAKPSYPGPGAWLHGGGRALMRQVLAGSPIDSAEVVANLFEHDFGVCNAYRGGMLAAAEVQCPTTLILGTKDQMTRPAAARELASALGARVVMLPGGHALMQELPDPVLAALREGLSAR